MIKKHKLLSLGMAFGLTVAATAAQSAPTPDTWLLNHGNVDGVGSGGLASNAMIGPDSTPYTYESQTSTHRTTASGVYAGGAGGSLLNGSAYLKHWSGLSFDRGDGDGADGNDSHTIDNYGHDEIVVFEFEEAISLQSFKFGYVGTDNSGDSDTTILYRNTVNGGNNMAGLNTGSLTSNGWNALAHIADVGTSTRSISNLTAGIYSKTWAIGAYLSNVVASQNGNGWLGTGASDGFKLAAITGVTRGGQVPLTGTHLLLILGLSLMLFSRSGVTGQAKE